jgi:hypothetical protein
MIGKDYNATYDGGKTYQLTDFHYLLVHRYTISPYKVEHFRESENIIGVLSKFGGLASLILNICRFLVYLINQQLYLAKFLRSLFHNNKGKLTIKSKQLFFSNCRNTHKDFTKGVDRVYEELDFIRHIQII